LEKITAGISDDAAVNAVREDPKRPGLLFASTETRHVGVALMSEHCIRCSSPCLTRRDAGFRHPWG